MAIAALTTIPLFHWSAANASENGNHSARRSVIPSRDTDKPLLGAISQLQSQYLCLNLRHVQVQHFSPHQNKLLKR
jgi:hypothetical protein